MTSRIVQAELLDSLPHDHSDAHRGRRDLRLVNALMGNHRWVARALETSAARGESILEVGTGFQGDELPRLLCLDHGQWSWRCSTAPFGANRMIAWHRDRVRAPR